MSNSEPKVILIVAVAQNGGIGKDNQLLWHLPADLKYFREKTMGYSVVMGRKNYESIPDKYRPLPGRTNIVVTRNHQYVAPGCVICSSLSEAIQEGLARAEKVFVIGGGEIYKEAMVTGICDQLLITRVHADFDADTWFTIPQESQYQLTGSQHHKADAKNPFDFTFELYNKIRGN